MTEAQGLQKGTMTMALSVTISVLGQQVTKVSNVPFTQGMNVQQAMEGAYATPPITEVKGFSLRYFGALGYELVTLDSISGQAGGDKTTFLFWELQINGQFVQHGIDETYPKDGDAIEWNYICYSEERHAGTRYEKIRDLIRGT
jgi:hypothetical protein